MKNKILNIPNAISFIRLVLIAPAAGYLFLVHKNDVAFLLSVFFIILDVLDGYWARKLKQETTLGAYLDAISDNFFGAALFLVFLYLGYVNFWIILLLAAHRFTRLILVLYVKFYGKGYYIPKHIKATWFINMIYVFFIPYIFEFFGRKITEIITSSIVGGTYLALVIAIIVAIYRFHRGRIKIQQLEKIPYRKIVRAERAKIKKEIQEIRKKRIKRKIKRLEEKLK